MKRTPDILSILTAVIVGFTVYESLGYRATATYGDFGHVVVIVAATVVAFTLSFKLTQRGIR